MADIDNDELMEEEGQAGERVEVPDVLVDKGKDHIGDMDDEPINEDEVTPEEYASFKTNRKLTTAPPEASKMYDILSHLREGYRLMRTMCINDKHVEYMDILDLLDIVIQDWVVECNDVEDRTKAKDSNA